MNHSFNVDIAKIFGVEEAIVIENMFFWIEKNKANEKHYYDGSYWTYNSMKAFSHLFPYWSEKQVRRILKSLEDQGCVKTGNYNKITYDRTKWYALTERVVCICLNGQMDLTKRANGFDQTGEPIPDINTDINTDINIKKINKKNFVSENQEIIKPRKKRKLSSLQKLIEERKQAFIEKVSLLYPKDKTDKEGFRRLDKFYDTKILDKNYPDKTIPKQDIFIQNLEACLELKQDYMFSLKNYIGTDSERSKNYYQENFIEKLEYQKNNNKQNKQNIQNNNTKSYCENGKAAKDLMTAEDKARELWDHKGIVTMGIQFDLPPKYFKGEITHAE